MDINGLLGAIIVLAIVGLCLWLIERYIPMGAPFKIAIRIVVVIALVLWLLSFLGITPKIRG